MKHIAFILSMPNVGSWDGKWTGEGDFHCLVRSYTHTKESPNSEYLNVISKTSHYYSFEDGWGASVRTEEIKGNQISKYKRLSKGFHGYNWMVDEIEEHGRILTRSERHKLEECNERALNV